MTQHYFAMINRTTEKVFSDVLDYSDYSFIMMFLLLAVSFYLSNTLFIHVSGVVFQTVLTLLILAFIIFKCFFFPFVVYIWGINKVYLSVIMQMLKLLKDLGIV